MNIIGLTGHSGSGKTTVAQIMSEAGLHHIDCDRLVHEKVYTNTLVLDKIKDAFGDEYVSEGKLERRKLGRLVFSDKAAYDLLMKTISADIKNALERELKQNSDRVVLLDAPALFEYGLQDICDTIIAVVSQNAIERICARDGLTVEEAENRLKTQKDMDFYKANCSILIENDSDLKSLEKKVKDICNKIAKENM